MRESSRISVLVVTAVVAVVGFAVLWITRPTADNEMVRLAQERQLQPLMEIDEPARLQKTVDEENRQLADDLYPYISKMILADKDIDGHTVSLMEPVIEEKVNTVASAMVDEKLAAVQASLDERARAIAEETATKIATDTSTAIATEVATSDATIDTIRTQLKGELDAYLPQAVDALIPQIVTSLVNEFVAKQDYYVPELQKMLEPYQKLNEEQAVALYTKYRNDIISDLVPVILDNVQSQIQPILDNYAGMVEPAVTSAPAVPKESATESAPAVPKEPATESAPVVPKEPATESAVITPSAPKAATAIVTPFYSGSGTPTVMDSEDYWQKREAIRKQQIQQVLDNIEAGKN